MQLDRHKLLGLLLLAILVSISLVVGYRLGRGAAIEVEWFSDTLPEMVKMCLAENPGVRPRESDEVDVWGGAWGGDAWLDANGVGGSPRLLRARSGLIEKREPCMLLRRYRVHSDLSVTLREGEEHRGGHPGCWRDPDTNDLRCGGPGNPPYSRRLEPDILDLREPGARRYFGGADVPESPPALTLTGEECSIEAAISHIVGGRSVHDCGTLGAGAKAADLLRARTCVTRKRTFQVVWEPPRTKVFLRRGLVAPGDGRVLFLEWEKDRADDPKFPTMSLTTCTGLALLVECDFHDGTPCLECASESEPTSVCE